MASTVIFNGVEYKNATAVKNAMRERVMSVCVKALKEEFGDELVKKVGSNEWGIVVGQISDEGCTIDAVTTLKPTAKEWTDRKTKEKTYERYDLEDNATAYEMGVKEKAEEKAKKEKEREEKKARDKAERERKKAEKEKKKAEKEKAGE
jgi:hypothetical protein